jgi:hypothetical protein
MSNISFEESVILKFKLQDEINKVISDMNKLLSADIEDLRREVRELRGYINPMIPLGPKPESEFPKIQEMKESDKAKLLDKLRNAKKIKDCKNLK